MEGSPSFQVSTLTALFMTSAVSSHTTMSTHFRLGSFSLRICFLTIASKARSGVNSPVLEGIGGGEGGRQHIGVWQVGVTENDRERN